MKTHPTVDVNMFGLLQTLRKERGLAYHLEITVPAEGRPAIEIARELDLPIDKIEGVFCNHVIQDLNYVIRPGDRIAFVPQGTPGPHRFFLGLYDKGKKSEK